MSLVLWNLLFFILSIGLLVLLHEAGHFYVARLCGVKIFRFSLGFGPVLWHWYDKDGIEYALSAIPLGGYVKMKGEIGMDGIEGHDPKKKKKGETTETIETDFAHLVTSEAQGDSFSEKSIWQRGAIILAGPFTNLIVAVIIYTILNIVGYSATRPVVAYATIDSIAETSGLQRLDLFTKVDGEPVSAWPDVLSSIVSNAGETIEVEVKRDFGRGETFVTNFDLRQVVITPQHSPFDELGIVPCSGKLSRDLRQVRPGSAADRAGMQVGDIVLAVNGIPTPDWYSMVDVSSRAPDHVPLEFLLQREGVAEPFILSFMPDYMYDTENNIHPLIGIGITAEPIPELMFERSFSPVEAFYQALIETKKMSMIIIAATEKMLSGHLSARNIGGPVAIAKSAGKSAERGIKNFLYFLAAISVNLGVLNLIPLPVLDGGQFVFVLYEGVMKRKPNQRVQTILTILGLGLLLGLTALAIVNDFIN